MKVTSNRYEAPQAEIIVSKRKASCAPQQKEAQEAEQKV